MFGCFGCEGAKEFPTIEQEFFAFVIQRGEFGDAGEDFTEDFGAWMRAGEFKRLFMKHLADCFLDAGLLREVAVAFHVGRQDQQLWLWQAKPDGRHEDKHEEPAGEPGKLEYGVKLNMERLATVLKKLLNPVVQAGATKRSKRSTIDSLVGERAKHFDLPNKVIGKNEGCCAGHIRLHGEPRT
jgi:hypothetical protein